MKADDITTALGDVGKKWTRQIKSEERSPGTRRYRESMYTISRTSLKDICSESMKDAWMKASGGGKLPTHWRQIFYVMRPIVDAHPESDRDLRDATFKNILEEYVEDYGVAWDILRGARGVFKEPHRADNDNGLAMSTMNVRAYLNEGFSPSSDVERISTRFPTHGAPNRFSAVLICEKEGFDDLLEAEHIPERFDLALMSTKGISAIAARDLVVDLGVPHFTLHDMDKNGFVMAGGFPHATDFGIRMEDVEKWKLESEPQVHQNPGKTYENLLSNGATDEEAEFISEGKRVELNMLTGPDFIEFVTGKLEEHGVEKVMPDDDTLAEAWERAHKVNRLNYLIESTGPGEPPADVDLYADIPPVPEDLEEQIRNVWDDDDDTLSWDEALSSLVDDDDEGLSS